MSWRRLAVELVVGSLLIAGLARAVEAPSHEAGAATNTPNPSAQHPPARVQAAPRGGDMIVAPPALQYVTHGRVGSDGRVTTECTRNGAPTSAPTRGQ